MHYSVCVCVCVCVKKTGGRCAWIPRRKPQERQPTLYLGCVCGELPTESSDAPCAHLLPRPRVEVGTEPLSPAGTLSASRFPHRLPTLVSGPSRVAPAGPPPHRLPRRWGQDPGCRATVSHSPGQSWTPVAGRVPPDPTSGCRCIACAHRHLTRG